MKKPKYIELKSGALVDRYEWYGGLLPKPKESKARRKAVEKGEAEIVDSDYWEKPRKKKKILRKR